MMLNSTCDFCYKRKRACDGLAQRRCSFCAAKNQAECHYRRRRPPSRPRDAGASRPGSSSSASSARRKPGHHDVGRSFWRTDDSDAATAEEGGTSDEATSEVDDCREPALLLPLKRGRFSASPATGLVGLQENEFLGDFFGCLGFLGLTNQSTVRAAMVRIMLAGGPAQYPQRRPRGAPLKFRPSPIRCQGREAGNLELVGETFGDARQAACGERSTSVDGGRPGSTLAAKGGIQTLPRDSSTCILWCAVSLGALVRGHPLAQVGRYAGLAEDSLWACRDDATLDTARAYIATAILHDFLGNLVKTHEYLKIANGIVDGLPPEEIPRGFHGLLQYTGMARILDAELATAEETKGYWENAAPIWELPESIGEQDICGLVLSVCVRMNQPFVDETGVNRVLFAEKPQPQPSDVKPVAYRSFLEKTGLHDAQSAVGEGNAPPLGGVAVAEEGQVCLTSIVASSQAQKSVLPEMLRAQECIESSKMHQGIGGLLFYGNLAYLQALNDKATGESFMRAIDVILRYPGLCRYKTWMWIVHSYIFLLAFTQRRRKYEELRASYNSALPPGSKPAPPFDECREISDICDHAYCRKTIAHMMYVKDNGSAEHR